MGPLGRLEGADASASARALTCWQAGPGVSGRESARGRARRGASARGLCGTLGCSGSRPVRSTGGRGPARGASLGRGEVGCAEEEKSWAGSWVAWDEVVGRTGFWIF